MQAIVLAAGVGSRLQSLNQGRPKVLVEFGGRPLILHQLEALADHGVGPVLCVIGHQADDVRKVIGSRAEVLVNERYAETNSLYSLWMARQWVRGPFLLLNCDLLFDPGLLDALLSENGSVLAYDSTSSRGREQTKVAIRDRRVMDLGKDLPASSARGESLGLLKFDAQGAKLMLEVADQMVQAGHEKAWVIEATRAVCQQIPVYGLNVAGRPWVEIDFPHDLDVARREVWPAIWRGRWRRHVYWRRSRWVLLGGGALALAAVGWMASTRIGPASIDWETVPFGGAEAVRIERGESTQRWWQARLGDSLVAQVSGPLAAVEVRLIMPPGAADTLRYVVGLGVDGRPYDWRSLTAVRDAKTSFGPHRVADRDRIELAMAPGPHRLVVTLVAGHGERMLARVRQPERGP